MIYVSEDQLTQVEYLIWQSSQGNHLLFEPHAVREVLYYFSSQAQDFFSDSDAYEVEHHIERLIEQPTLKQKRAYLEGLDGETYRRVVRTYFNIVENRMYEGLRENPGMVH